MIPIIKTGWEILGLGGSERSERLFIRVLGGKFSIFEAKEGNLGRWRTAKSQNLRGIWRHHGQGRVLGIEGLLVSCPQNKSFNGCI